MFKGAHLLSSGCRPNGDQGSGLGEVTHDSVWLQDSMMVEHGLSAGSEHKHAGSVGSFACSM